MVITEALSVWTNNAAGRNPTPLQIPRNLQ